jgi:hypothetical protein
VLETSAVPANEVLHYSDVIYTKFRRKSLGPVTLVCHIVGKLLQDTARSPDCGASGHGVRRKYLCLNISQDALARKRLELRTSRIAYCHLRTLHFPKKTP